MVFRDSRSYCGSRCQTSRTNVSPQNQTTTAPIHSSYRPSPHNDCCDNNNDCCSCWHSFGWLNCLGCLLWLWWERHCLCQTPGRQNLVGGERGYRSVQTRKGRLQRLFVRHTHQQDSVCGGECRHDSGALLRRGAALFGTATTNGPATPTPR